MATAQKIIESLKRELDTVILDAKNESVGTVLEVFDGVVRVSGLSTVQASEVVTFPNGVEGMVLNLEADFVGVIVLGDYKGIKEGDIVHKTGHVLEIPVGDGILGHVVNATGAVIDGRGDYKATAHYPVERIAPGVITRQSVDQPLQTGIKAIDALVPIGRGQRELIIGDRKTGKTAIALDTILNQKGTGVICIYVSIGQKDSRLRSIETLLRDSGAMDYTVIVSAGASEPAALSYIAPYAGSAIAEFFMDQGKDVLIVYDDLSKHAVSYREISLLLRRPPGREAFPGDVFYLHSRLLERACRRNAEYGGGSITALPIIETQAGDLAAYIPTNVISITDGQIFLETDLFYKGIRPAINVGNSVSRVGSSAQQKAMKKVAGTLKLDLAQFRELEAFSQFGSDLDENTKRQLERGKRAVELLKQTQYNPFAVSHQVISLYGLTKGYLDDVPLIALPAFQKSLIEYVELTAKEFIADVEQKGMWTDESEALLQKAITDHKAQYFA
ncbi:MAG: F0F1 ATP synthase subunit alpha [Candidatus Paceibacterota bacterium]